MTGPRATGSSDPPKGPSSSLALFASIRPLPQGLWQFECQAPRFHPLHVSWVQSLGTWVKPPLPSDSRSFQGEALMYASSLLSMQSVETESREVIFVMVSKDMLIYSHMLIYFIHIIK